jgi:hypothetical protein
MVRTTGEEKCYIFSILANKEIRFTILFAGHGALYYFFRGHDTSSLVKK